MKFQEQVPLSEWSHYKIGGPARVFARPRTPGEVRSAVAEAKRRKLPFFVLGGGTNLLFSDEGFGGLVIRPEITFVRRKGNRIEAGAGASMKDVLELAAKQGLAGLEWAGGLPGTLGGAVRGNAGCFGGEIKDVIVSVAALDTRTMKVKRWTNKECRFGYRSSAFKARGSRDVILSAVLALRPGDKKAIRKVMEEKMAFRRERHPLEYPNVGSVFKNVPLAGIPARKHKGFAHVVKQDPFPVVPAAWLIAQAKLGGTQKGGAQVSLKHPNFIVNVLAASAADVKHLIAVVKKEVKKKFGIALEEEVMRVE
jgi:UDP-N-acetylmuramate dehydrogenase